jgi:hypothetical protein
MASKLKLNDEFTMANVDRFWSKDRLQRPAVLFNHVDNRTENQQKRVQQRWFQFGRSKWSNAAISSKIWTQTRLFCYFKPRFTIINVLNLRRTNMGSTSERWYLHQFDVRHQYDATTSCSDWIIKAYEKRSRHTHAISQAPLDNGRVSTRNGRTNVVSVQHDRNYFRYEFIHNVRSLFPHVIKLLIHWFRARSAYLFILFNVLLDETRLKRIPSTAYVKMKANCERLTNLKRATVCSEKEIWLRYVLFFMHCDFFC